MKISIENFKSIRKLKNFELKPFTIISGVNSSGKSSFIQFLLLLKQTIDLKSTNEPFYLEGDLYKITEYKDILFNKNTDNKLGFSFQFDKSDISIIESPQLDIFNVQENYLVDVSFQFDILNDRIIVSSFDISIQLPEGKNQKINFLLESDNNYSINTNTAVFGDKLWNENFKGKVNFLSLFPLYYEVIEGDFSDNQFLKIEWVRKIFDSFFNTLSYIGPLREQPKDEYFVSKQQKTVGARGEFVARILQEYANQPISFYKIEKIENGINYIKHPKSLAEAVKYWMCDVFEVAKDIRAEKTNDAYKILLENNSGLTTSIKHVGFGISQLLPIVVEGLRLPENGTLIIEQPEVHLHPKIQSLLYDFLYSLTLQNKKVIVETHSSHFITRMRRRIAEDESNGMDDRINLTFIENNIFRTIEMDDYGTLEYYPKDFIEQSNVELRAIVKAQMNKRIKNQ